MPKLSLAMIVRDVEPIIGRALNSVKHHVDEIVIGDTGSSDGTLAAIEAALADVKLPVKILNLGPEAHPELYLPDTEEYWRSRELPGPFSGRLFLANFAAARNHTFDATTGDWIFWLDSDDVVRGADQLRWAVTECEGRKHQSAILPYHYAFDHHGNPICVLLRERLMKRGIGKWTKNVHEVYAPVGSGSLFEEIVILHKRYDDCLPVRVHHRNLKILLKSLEDEVSAGELDARTLFYLAMEERFLFRERSIEHFTKYISMSGWDEERGLAYLMMGQLHEMALRLREAYRCYALSSAEFFWNPDPIFGMGRLAYFQNDWEKCIEHMERAFTLNEACKKRAVRVQTLMYDQLDREHRPYVFYARALAELGRLEDALSAYQKGLKAVPDDRHFLESSQILRKALMHRNDVIDPSKPVSLKFAGDAPVDGPPMDVPTPVLLAMALELWKRNMEEKLYTRAIQLLDTLPAEIALHPRVAEARKKNLAKLDKTDDGLPIMKRDELSDVSLAEHERLQTILDHKLPEPQPAGSDGQRFERKPTEAATTPKLEVAQSARLSVLIWTGPGFESWGPISIERGGIGGSETAVVHMARELCRRGHQVRVLSDCEPYQGIHDGVEYLHFPAIQHLPTQTPDILVTSRQPEIVLAEDKLQPKATLLWVHDIHCGSPTTRMHEAFLRIDRCLCLSEWHRGFFLDVYPFLNPATVLVTRNGIDTSLYAREPRKEGNRLIFSSSPNRGLDVLLEYLPEIEAQVPDVELHVYYGFKNWRRAAEMSHDEAQLRLIGDFEARIRSSKHVVWHDRVSQRELAQAQLASKIWAYPTAFSETSCLHGDSMVSVPGNHRDGLPVRVPIKSLVGKTNFPVYCFDEKEKRFRIGTAKNCVRTKVASSLLALELDDGSVLKVTPDHQMMNFDGEWLAAEKLKVGDRLMALHHRYHVSIKDYNGRWIEESRLVGEWMANRRLGKDEHVDHLDEMRLDNRPESLQILTAANHFRKTHANKILRKSQIEANGNRLRKWVHDNMDEVRRRNIVNGKNLWKKVRAMSQSERKAWQTMRTDRQMKTIAERMKDPAYAETARALRVANGKKSWTVINSWSKKKRAAYLRKKSAATQRTIATRKMMIPGYTDRISQRMREGHLANGRNHKIIKITKIAGAPVYDMEVKTYHNFVAEGVVVHNCITGMEVQAAGCVPVTTHLAALPETVSHGVLLKAPYGSPEYRAAFVKWVVRFLRDDAEREKFARAGRAYALEHHGWDKIAAEWERMFHTVLAEKKKYPLTLYGKETYSR